MTATWVLGGECILALAGPVAGAGRRILRPCLLVAASYQSSPVGPYLELALVEPARNGARPAMRVTTMAVSSSASCEEGRRLWGFPKHLAALHWEGEGEGTERGLTCDEPEIVVRAGPVGPPIPVVVPGSALQDSAGGQVRVPLVLRGKLRLARVSIGVPPDGPLAHLDGTRPGAVVTGLRLVVGPARPVSRLSPTHF